MSPEYRGDGDWVNRSHKEAAVQLMRDIGSGLPRFYLQSLIEHPGWTSAFTLWTVGMGIALAGQRDIGMAVAGVGFLVPPAGLAANAVQVLGNIWNEYRLGTDSKEITMDFIANRVLKIRNFL